MTLLSPRGPSTLIKDHLAGAALRDLVLVQRGRATAETRQPNVARLG